MGLLTAHKWRVAAFTEATTTPTGVTSTEDFYAATMPCTRDNFVTYSANKTFTEDEGPTKCQSYYPQSVTLPWEFTANEAGLTLDSTPTGFNITWQIGLLTATDFVLVRDETISSGTAAGTRHVRTIAYKAL